MVALPPPAPRQPLMHESEPSRAKPPLLGVRALQAVAALLLFMRLGFVSFAFPLGDEAYYWIWGQHPDLSYLDHPPLNAWLLGLSSQIFGWSTFALRFPALLTTAGSVLVFWLWSRHIDVADRRHWFWLAVVAYFATPMIGIFSGMVFPDHLLIFLSLCALYAFSRFFETWDAGSPQWPHLFGAAILLGLAALSKYNAVFVAIAVVLHVGLAPRRLALLARWQVYAAALLCLVTLAPLLIWNATRGLASFEHHTIARYSDLLANLSLDRFGYFLLFAVIYLGPVLSVAVLAMLVSRRPLGPAPANGRDLGRLTFLSSSTVFGLLSARGALPYWNIVAYAALFPHVVSWIGARFALIAHLTYGVLVTGVFLVNYAFFPVVPLLGGTDPESAYGFGWDEIAAHVAEAEALHGPGFLAASRYSLAAQLSFARGRDDVTLLATGNSQYDHWFDGEAHAGRSALILADAFYGLDAEVSADFATMTEVDRFEVVRFGRPLMTYVLYFAERYHGD